MVIPSCGGQKLNLGCGPVQPEGWINVDGSQRAWVASHLPAVDRVMVSLRLWRATEFNRTTRFADLRTRLPWSADSVECIYMGEVLEHFTREEGERLLHECCRILKRQGVLRVRVPD